LNWRLRFLYLAANFYWRLFKPLTIGVKILFLREGKVLLVRHTYQSGWFLPGGGVKKHEFVAAAAHREAAEELGAAIHEMDLFGIYSNVSGGRNDQVILFTSNEFMLGERDQVEIAAAQFFPLDQLPSNVSPGTVRRLREYERWGEDKRPYVRIW
jgi:ADP-ribose pyrophosphatase YjhB (NUDIX family)